MLSTEYSIRFRLNLLPQAKPQRTKELSQDHTSNIEGEWRIVKDSADKATRNLVGWWAGWLVGT
jgi:hypothetical protein